LLASFCGCAGYQLGPTNGLAPREKSIQINPFINKTLEPRLTDAVTEQLRKEIQRDGTFRLETHDPGDIIVSGMIINYQRSAVSFQPSDTLTPLDFRLALTAHVTARERSSGNVILDKQVTGFTLMRVENDLVSSERQALPMLAADLAKHVTALLADGTW